MKKILIVGFGDVAERMVRRYAGQAEFIGVIRRPERAAELRALGVTPYLGDLDAPATLKRLPRVDGVFHFAPPPNEGKTDPRTAHLLHALGRRKPGALVYISTSGVYGDCGGNWVSRNASGGAGERARGAAGRRRAPTARLGRRTQGVQVSILRAPGIYAADRLPLARIRRGTPGADCRGRQLHQPHPRRRPGAAGVGGAVPRPLAAHLPCGRRASAENGRLVRQLRRCLRSAATAAGQARRGGKLLSEALLSFLRESRQLSNARTTRELRLKYRYPTSDDLLREIKQARQQMKLF
jgi:hypothetical protein